MKVLSDVPNKYWILIKYWENNSYDKAVKGKTQKKKKMNEKFLK